jgi:hypothetical protein
MKVAQRQLFFREKYVLAGFRSASLEVDFYQGNNDFTVFNGSMKNLFL